MCLEPDDELLAALFRARTRDAAEEPDLNRIVELAAEQLSPEAAEEILEILSLDPETRADLVALREEMHREGEGEAGEPNVQMLKAVAGARWWAALRIGYTKEGLFRVTDPGAPVRFPRWVDRVFAMGRRMTGGGEVGVWPTEKIEFGWPGEDPILLGSVSVRKQAPVLTVRRSLSGRAKETAGELKLKYWRGNQWVGVETLRTEEPQLAIRLKPKWPYILAVRGEEPLVLKVVTHQVEFSPAELRAAALLRVVAGDVDGGFGLIRSRLVPVTRVFRWTLGLLSRCLPEEAAQAGYAVVRDAATQEEVRSGLKELFETLAAGWLEATGGAMKEGGMERALEEKKGPVARGFALALGGSYREAATFWESSEEDVPSEPHVAAALYLARRLSVGPESPPGTIQPLADEDLERVMRCARGLPEGKKQGEDSVEGLAEGLAEVCR